MTPHTTVRPPGALAAEIRRQAPYFAVIAAVGAGALTIVGIATGVI